LTETKKLQEEYWTQFRDHIESRDTPLRGRKPKPQHWYNNPIGKSGYKLQFTVNTVENRLYAQLIIKDDSEAFQFLEQQKEQIEEEMGESFIWHPPEEAQGESNRSKITLRRDGVLPNKGAWEDYHKWMLEQGEKVHEVFASRIQQL